MKRCCLAVATLLAIAGCQSKPSQTTAPAVPSSSSPASTPSSSPASALAPGTPAAATLSAAAEKGRVLSEKCAACHYFNTENKVGPGLAGIFGRKAGAMAGYDYEFTSYIQPGKSWHWDAAHLAAWMCSSSEAVIAFTGDGSARTRMPSQHICDPTKQAELTAYLKTL